MFGSRLLANKAASLPQHLAERNGLKATARLIGVAPDTVVPHWRLAGADARQPHEGPATLSPCDPTR